MSKGQKILVFGANSAICQAVLRLYAEDGACFYLLARDAEKLAATADDLVVRGGTVAGTASYDFNAWSEHANWVSEGQSCLGGIDIAMVAHGSLPDHTDCTVSSAAVKACMDDNFTSAAVILQACAQQLSEQGCGSLAILSSVAGDRGRKGNYFYGAAKAGLDALVQGLQGRFAGTGIKVVNIKPGMVISPMTSTMSHGPLWATPNSIAPAIRKAIARGRKVSYVPGYWRVIMLIIRTLPTGILARLPI